MGIRARPRPHHIAVHDSNLAGADGGAAALPQWLAAFDVIKIERDTFSKIGAHHYMRTDELVTGHAERTDDSDACGGKVLGQKPTQSARRGPVY